MYVIGGRLLATFAACVVALFPAVAWADDPGHDGQDAKDLVLQAIALIVNTPDDHEAIEHRIEEALEASDHEDVDLEHVTHAAEALEKDDLRATRDFLQSAIGAGPFVGTGEPKPIREGTGEPGHPAYAVGGESGTVVVLDEYRPDRGLDAGNLVLVLLSAAAVIGGGLLAWWFRPADTVRPLRRSGESGQEE